MLEIPFFFLGGGRSFLAVQREVRFSVLHLLSGHWGLASSVQPAALQ